MPAWTADCLAQIDNVLIVTVRYPNSITKGINPLNVGNIVMSSVGNSDKE